MSNERLPNEIWIEKGLDDPEWYMTEFLDNPVKYILASRVDKMIRLALLEKDLECEVSCYGHNPVHNVLKSEINQLREELK